MTRRRDCLIAGAALAAMAGPSGRVLAQQTPPSNGEPARRPDVVFVPTPQAIVDEMLSVARVGPNDVLYDLGSGDGRIPITAARRWGTRGLGVDIDPQRIQEANSNATAAGVTDRVRFVQGDLFTMDLTPATVITLYLLPALNARLMPRLLKLKAGTRIVSHDFPMGDWKPDRTIERESKVVYYWTVPPAGRPYPKG
ncbi:MAG: class I SAM-dependent methyltransferase [Burkholderiales bacterium]|nr:MAG: class I SAM-dependent methyltransferase [Burkholderiales bacterium]